MKINYKKLQDDSEIECTEKFLPSFNNFHNSYFKDPKKNAVENEIDIICIDKYTNIPLNIQVKKADPIIVGNLGRSRKTTLQNRPLITRDQDQAELNMLNNIFKVEQKYLKQGKDVSDIILLLDELMDPPKFIIESIKSKIVRSSFKEIWLVTRNSNVFKLY